MESTKDFLKFILDKTRTSQAEVARRLKTTEVSIHRYIVGEREPKFNLVIRFCNVCGYTLSDAIAEYENYNILRANKVKEIEKKSNKTVSREYAFVFSKDESGEEYLRRYIKNEDNTQCTAEIVMTKEVFQECYNRWIKEK